MVEEVVAKQNTFFGRPLLPFTLKKSKPKFERWGLIWVVVLGREYTPKLFVLEKSQLP